MNPAFCNRGKNIKYAVITAHIPTLSSHCKIFNVDEILTFVPWRRQGWRQWAPRRHSPPCSVCHYAPRHLHMVSVCVEKQIVYATHVATQQHVTVYLAEHTHIFKEARVVAIAPLSVIDICELSSICIKLEIHNCSQLGTVCKASSWALLKTS